MQAIYLHGFASSAESSKARFFSERLAAHGVRVARPDLNLPDFSTITVGRMIADTEAVLAAHDPGDVVLFGSSMGGFVAWHVAARAEAAGRGVRALVLLAPALDVGSGAMCHLGTEALARWKDTGWIEYFHHAYGSLRQLHYEFVAEAAAHDAALARVTCPVLVFQGRHDAVVDPGMVTRFAAARPNVRLRLLEDDHQLHGQLDDMWRETASFLGLE